MNRTIAQIITDRGEGRHFRQAFMRSPFCQQTTLADILTDPDRTRQALAVTPGAGELAIARLRRLIEEEMTRAMATDRAAAIVADPEARMRDFAVVWAEAARSYPLSGVFHDGFADPGNPVMASALVTAQPFVYAPVSVPEVLKTPAVLSCEMGDTLIPPDYAGRLAQMRADGSPLPAGSLILLDRQVMTDLADGRGDYASLCPAEAARQIDILAAYLLGDTGVETVLTDFRRTGFSSGFATAQGPLYHYCFGGYAELRGRDVLDLFMEKARAARDAGQPLADWIAARKAAAAAGPDGAPRAMAEPRR